MGAQFYVWPLEKRLFDEHGNHGSLHAKVAVADGRRLLLSSANLTDYALNLNMEMGVLIEGGALPARAQQHFESLMTAQTLIRVVTGR